MTDSVWKMFPYPTLVSGDLTDGSTMSAHPDCIACPTRACTQEASQSPEVKTCRYGLSFARIDDDRLTVGMVASTSNGPQSAAVRRQYKDRDRHARPEHILRAVETVRGLGPGVANTFAANRQAMLEHLAGDETMQRALAEKLRRDFDSNVAQSHDFLQLVKLVRGHAEVLLKTKHPNLTPEDAADQELALGAIYYSTSLMIAKLDALVYLNEINRAFGNERDFRLHPLILKYIRIYLWQAKQKGVHITLEENYATCYYDGAAIGAVVQSLLDNLVKYAPANSKASIRFAQSDGAVRVDFVSLGPRISARERREIFMPGARGIAAQNGNSEGQGIGLATVKAVSDALDLHVRVHQDSEPTKGYIDSFETTFSISLVPE
jgi:signal transduction histidine kinase